MTALATAPAVAALADSRFEAAIAQLSAYLRHPAISCDPAHHGDLRALAQRIRADLAEHGFEDAAVVELPEALPLVAASWMGAGPDRPTVLIYGHFDLQPVKGEPWSTPPHEATRKGDRLYARGAADDMGGWVSHLVALAAWREGGGLPCNIRLVIEGEEEIGSPNLERYMDAYPELFDADVMVLTDCENPSVDLPGLTVSLRGLMEVELRCEALTADVHSGLWGNMAPDASVTLCRLIASLVDEDGRLAVGRCEVEPGFEEKAAVVPLTDEVICGGAHVAEGLCRPAAARRPSGSGDSRRSRWSAPPCPRPIARRTRCAPPPAPPSPCAWGPPSAAKLSTVRSASTSWPSPRGDAA
jgi:cysteinylglycine-S-conjugate dipeptidase